MGKVLAPLHSIVVVGKVGGVAFRRWRNLSIAQDADTGNPGDPEEASFAAWMALNSYWAGLTEAQREAWRDFGRRTPVEGGPLKPNRRSGYMWARTAAWIASKISETAPAVPWGTAAPGAIAGLALGVNGSGNWELEWSASQEADYVGYRWVKNQKASVRFYDYKLGAESFAAVSAESVEGPAAVSGKKARAAVRLIRDTSQGGFISYVEAVAP